MEDFEYPLKTASTTGRQPDPPLQQAFLPFSVTGRRDGSNTSWQFPSLLALSNSHVARLKSPIVAPPRPGTNRLSVTVSSLSHARKQRHPWNDEEDVILSRMLKAQEQDGNFNWTEIAAKVNPLRTGKQCRERWQNHLRSDIKKGNWSVKEEQMIESMFQAFGPKWSSMSKLLTNRTDNDIKNKWNSMMRSRRTKILRQQQQAMEESPPLLRPRPELFHLPVTVQSPGRGGVYLEDNQNIESMAFPLKNSSGKNVVVPVAAAQKDTHPYDSTHRVSMGAPSSQSSSPQNRTGKASYLVKQESPSRYCYDLSQPTRVDDVGTGNGQSYDAVSV